MGSETLFTPASSPESVGIPSQAILNFLQRIDVERINMHGYLLVRRNRIAQIARHQVFDRAVGNAQEWFVILRAGHREQAEVVEQ